MVQIDKIKGALLHKHKANEVNIVDANGYYTGTEVETALQEIGAGTTLDSRYVNVTGDTMTGSLVLSKTADELIEDSILKGTLIIDTASTKTQLSINSIAQSTHTTGTITNMRGSQSVGQVSGNGNIDNLIGGYNLAQLITGTGVANNSAVGVFGDFRNDSTATQGVGVGVFGSITNSSTGIITLATSVSGGTISNTGGGTVTNAISFYSFLQSAGTNNWGYYDEGNDSIINADNKGWLFGAGTSGDAKAYYDGTDFVLDPQITGTGKVKILNGGLLTDTIGETTAGAGITLSDQLILANQTDAIKTDNYSGYFKSGVTGTASPPSSSDANVVGFWKMDTGSGTTLVDSSANGYDGTITSAAWTGSGYFGYTGDNSITFNGTASFCDLSSHAANLKHAVGTIQMWFKGDVTSGQVQALYGAGSGTTDWFTIWLGGNMTGLYADESLGVIILSGGVNIVQAYIRKGTDYYNDGTWHFLVVQQTGTGLKIFIDAVEQTLSFPVGDATTAGWTNINTSTSVFLGKRTYPGSPLFFRGVMDNPIYYDDKRTVAEITADYNRGIPSGDAWVFDTKNSLSTGSNIALFNSFGTTKAKINTDGNIIAVDLTIDTDLLVTDSLLNTVSITGDTILTGELSVSKSITLPISTKTGAYTITASDYTILADATSAAFTITLPTTVGISGRIYNIKKIDSSANAITIDANGAETIDGATTYVIGTQYDSITVQSDNSGWQII